MSVEIRQLEPADTTSFAAARELHAETFALTEQQLATAPPFESVIWGAFSDGRLVATARDYDMRSWFGGAAVPTSGIGDVSVMPEHRGGGLASALLTPVLRSARARGAVISTLFGSAPLLYRKLGFALIATAYGRRLPLSALQGLRAPAGIVVKRAADADLQDIRTLYDAQAARSTAMIDRAGRSPVRTIEGARHSVAYDDDGSPRGYATWRTRQHEGRFQIVLHELHGDRDAIIALLRSLASWGSVADSVQLQCGDGERMLQIIPGNALPSGQLAAYMLRVLDLPGAVAARGWNRAVTATVVIAMDDDRLPEASGCWRMSISDGQISPSETTDQPDLTFTPEGAALWYSGVVTCADLRAIGLVRGEDAVDGILDAVARQPQPVVTEYF